MVNIEKLGPNKYRFMAPSDEYNANTASLTHAINYHTENPRRGYTVNKWWTHPTGAEPCSVAVTITYR